MSLIIQSLGIIQGKLQDAYFTCEETMLPTKKALYPRRHNWSALVFFTILLLSKQQCKREEFLSSVLSPQPETCHQEPQESACHLSLLSLEGPTSYKMSYLKNSWTINQESLQFPRMSLLVFSYLLYISSLLYPSELTGSDPKPGKPCSSATSLPVASPERLFLSHFSLIPEILSL